MRSREDLEDHRKDVAIDAAVGAAWKAEWLKALGQWLVGVGIVAGIILFICHVTGLGALLFHEGWPRAFACYGITLDFTILAGIILWGTANCVRSMAEHSVENLLGGGE